MIPLNFRQWSGSTDTGMNLDGSTQTASGPEAYIGDIGAEQNGEERRPRIPAGVCRRTGTI